MSPHVPDPTPTRGFPALPFWLDDDPARMLRDGLSRAGLEGWAIGAGVRDAAMELNPFSPPVVEVLVTGAPDALARGLRLSGLDIDLPRVPAPSVSVRAGATRFVLNAIGAAGGTRRLDAAARGRDFTANAVLCRLDGSLHDPLGGMPDIAGRRVRLAQPAALRDDPVRVVRLARMRIVLGEASPDPEALAEAGIYGAEVPGAPAGRVLAEMGRLVRCGPAARVAGALRDLDAWSALDGIALLPDVGRLGRFLAACEAEGIVPDPGFALGVLSALRPRGSGWLHGLRHRFGDSRDARAARPAEVLSSPPGPGDDGLDRLLRSAEPAGSA